MRRSPFKQRRFTTKLKHRIKLNAKYDPRRRIRIVLIEQISLEMNELLNKWANLILGDSQNENTGPNPVQSA